MTDKRATTSVPIHSVLENRWSPRAFADKQIADADLQALFEAARWAASSSNLQPWRFLLGFQGDDLYRKILSHLASGNQEWARYAPVLMATAVQKFRVASNGSYRPNPHSWHDLGLAMGNLSAQATALGLHLHQMGGVNREALAESFALDPEKYEVVSAVALGYRSEDLEQLSPKNQDSEQALRRRKELSELVTGPSFGGRLEELFPG